MSNAPFYSTAMRWGVKAGPGVLLHDGLARGRVTAGGQNHPVPGGMIETAENLRREYGIPREEQDEFAVRSHQRAAAAGRGGPVRRRDRPGHRARAGRATPSSTATSTSAPDTTLETLAKLRPIMGRDDPEATVTAGNASGQNDGAAVCVVTTPEKAAELGLRPLARLVSWAVGRGAAARRWASARSRPRRRRWTRAGAQLADIDLIELNEAFAARCSP